LGDITFVELPEPGRVIKQGESIAVVDSVKAASDVFAPASGTVTDINQLLEGEPELVNTSPEESGWLYRLRLSAPDELAGLMDRAAYDAYVAGL
jgi:glycine cleavage system H protein